MIARHDPRSWLPNLRAENPALGWLGGSAVLAGAAVGVAIASLGIDRRSAALAGAASLLWMTIRWFGVRLAEPSLLAENPAALRGAVSLGLLAYAFAVTPELRFAAWAVSGAVTSAMLLHLGRQRREVVRAVGFAWGMQAFVVAGGLLARNVVAAILAARG